MNCKPKILAVDDTPTNLHTLIAHLGKEYRLSVTTNGEQALNILRKEDLPDLILLDIIMPDLNGFEVCQRIKQSPEFREIPIIFVSALEHVEEKVHAFSCGGVDYIIKPFQPEELTARVKMHLNVRRMQKELETQNAHLDDLVRQKTKELSKAHDRLALADHSKSEFLKLISHEFRTPTNGILGISELILDECEAYLKDDELHNLFCTARDRMISTLDDALMLTEIQVSKEAPPLSRIPLSPLLQTMASRSQDKLQAAETRLGAFPNTDIAVYGERELLETALLSLTLTVAAFTNPGNTIEFELFNDPTSATLTITGEGQTIDEDKIDTFFDMYSATRIYSAAESLGLKPAVAEKIISLYGGRVHICNTDRTGIEIRITLKKG